MSNARGSRAVIVIVAIAAPITAAIAIGGCDQGAPASPALPLAEASVVICPDLQPTFASIKSNLLDTNTCGATRGGKCHSNGGALYSGGLDYTVDASALYEEFLGEAGAGAYAQNIAGSDPNLLRVVPGDAGQSFLYIKLVTTSNTDPKYGSGMPFDFPGALCPSAVQAVETWIDNGARFEEPDAANVDAEADASDAD